MKLLVVEDDPVLQRSLAALLREEDYAVDLASDGEEGLFKAQQAGYSLVILDIQLPYLDGWEIVTRLRLTSTTPVLMLTARDSVQDRVKGLDRGADDYLPKPFDTEELLARIRALTRRTTGHADSVVRIGTLTINTVARRAAISGIDIPLTAREYRLLEFLALNRGRVVTRTDLYEQLFDENDNTFSNLLDVHVSNLRRKLGTDLITTRRGQGYCIE